MAGSEIKVMWERILNYTITEQKTSNIHEFLKAHGYSSSLIRAIKEDPEGIRLNGEPVLARTLLTPGDQLAIRITETKFSENIVPSDLPLSIVYEDPDLLVINKPAGMPIHPSQGNYDNTLANACAWYFKEKGEPFVYRCINRLDRDTTGLLIIARHLYSASLLSAMMARREIHREYLALATGIVPEEGIITAPISHRAPSGNRTHSSDPGAYELHRSSASGRFSLPSRGSLYRPSGTALLPTLLYPSNHKTVTDLHSTSARRYAGNFSKGHNVKMSVT